MTSLLAQYKEAGGEIKSQQALLEVVIHLLDAALQLGGGRTSNSVSSSIYAALAPHRDRLFEISCQSLMGTAKDEVSYRIVALKILLRMAKVHDFLAPNELDMIVQYLNEILLADEDYKSDRLKDEAVAALVEISKFRSDLIMNVTFPTLIAQLPGRGLKATTSTSYLSTLEYLARLSVEKNVFETLLRRLTDQFRVAIQESGDAAYAQALLTTLLHALNHRDLARDPDIERYYEKFVVTLLTKMAVTPDERPILRSDDEVTHDEVGRVANSIIRALSGETQKKVTSSDVFISYLNISTSIAWDEVPIQQRRLEIISTHLIAALRREVGRS